MKREDYYKKALLLSGCYKRKAWVISAFAVVRDVEQTEEGVPAPYAVRYSREQTEVYVPQGDDDWGWVTISDAEPYTPLLYPCDPLKVTPDDIPLLGTPVDSTYGDLLFNWIVVYEPFGARIPYQVGPVNISRLEKLVTAKVVSDPLVLGREANDEEIPVSALRRYGRCIGYLAGFTQIFVPTLSPKSLQTDPGVPQRRAELLKENEDRLFDPVVQAKIQNELIAMDREWIKGDPSEGFLLSNKTFGTARKRMFLIHGPEAGFDEGGNAELVVNSLNEGWDTDHVVAMFNSTRAGSFYRGAQTALGGEAVKFFMRMFQNVTIGEEDCGSRLGLTHHIREGTSDWYVGMYEIVSSGIRPVTRERAGDLEGKKVLMRSPAFCKTKGTDFCARCVGDGLAGIPTALAQEATAVASKFMDIMMASAHAKELKTAKLDFTEAFT